METKINQNENNQKLEQLSNQLKGQIYIPEHFDKTTSYQLYTAPYLGAEIKYYDVQSPLMALRLIDILIDQYDTYFENPSPVIGLQFKIGDGEWEVWEDSEGSSIKEYYYDENWRLIEPVEED